MTPEPLPNDSALIRREERGERNNTTTTNVVGRRGDGGEADFEAVAEQLRARRVNAGLRSMLEHCSLDGCVRTIAWWDEQQRGSNAPGPGVLVETIRRGGIVERQDPEDDSARWRQVEFRWHQVFDWLRGQLEVHSTVTGLDDGELYLAGWQWWWTTGQPGVEELDSRALTAVIAHFRSRQRWWGRKGRA